MEPQRKRRADRHRQPGDPSHEAQATVSPAHSDEQAHTPPQDAPLGQALSNLGKSSGQVMSALLSSGSAAMGKLSKKIQDGSLARDFKRNDTLKQGIIFGLPVLMMLIGSGFTQIWLLLGMIAACYYLWRYQLGYDRRTRWDYLLLLFPLFFWLINNLPLMGQLSSMVTQMTSRGRYYGSGVNPYQFAFTLAPMLAYNVQIFLFAWMRARTPALLKGVRIAAIIGLVVTVIAGIYQYSYYGGYYRFVHFLYPTLTYLIYFGVILYFCKCRQQENDFTAYQLNPGEKWRPVMALFAMYLGIFGVHRSRLGYPTSARVIRWGLISLIIGTVILSLLTATLSLGAIQFGLVLFYISLAYFLIAALWAFVDIFRIILGHLKPAAGSYAPSEVLSPKRQSPEM